MAWEYSKLDKEVTQRMKKLGDFGEFLAEQLLRKAGFSEVRNLNEERYNNEYADLYAERKSKKYVISVRTRNKYENNGNLNSRYKLGADCYKHAAMLEEKFDAVAAWVTIAVEIDKGTFSAYFGTLESLHGNKGVLMTDMATSNYEKLAGEETFIGYGVPENIYKKLKNIYKRKN